MLYRNILNATALLFSVTHLFEHSISSIAYYHLVFVMIIPTHIVYCICITLFFILPNQSGTLWFLCMGMV